jgi:hypothetical protein
MRVSMRKRIFEDLSQGSRFWEDGCLLSSWLAARHVPAKGARLVFLQRQTGATAEDSHARREAAQIGRSALPNRNSLQQGIGELFSRLATIAGC